MPETENRKITVETAINAPIEKVWAYFTEPEHIMNWSHASTDWHTPRAENDLKVGGAFNSRMEAKDGSSGFDFTGVYDEVVPNERIAYTMSDGRKVYIVFTPEGERTRIVQTFEMENENPEETQRSGWQMMLNNFKSYTEGV
jgi:uncharacterized protein YndB with AHSA1/START domain